VACGNSGGALVRDATRAAICGSGNFHPRARRKSKHLPGIIPNAARASVQSQKRPFAQALGWRHVTTISSARLASVLRACCNSSRMDHGLSRRRVAFVLGGGFAALSAPAQTQKHGTTIHQEVDFDAPPARLYEVLLDAKQFSALTMDSAEIQPQAGAPFKLFGGRIEGRNIELVPNRRIVQAWRPSNWAAGVYSIVKFELVARGSGTLIVFDHSGFAESQWEGLSSGWENRYREPLHKYLRA